MVQPYKLTFLKLKPNDSLRATRHKREKEADICACIVENMIFWTVPTIQKILKIWRQWRMQTCSVKQCQHHLMGRSARHQYNLLRSSKPAYRKGALSNQCTEMAIYQHKSRNHYLLVISNYKRVPWRRYTCLADHVLVLVKRLILIYQEKKKKN